MQIKRSKISLFSILLFILWPVFVIGNIERDSLLLLLQSSAPAEQAKIYNKLSEINRNNNADLTLYYGSNALKLSDSLGLNGIKAVALINLSWYHILYGATDSAMNYLLQSRELYTKLNNLNGIGLCTKNIGTTYLFSNRYDSAEHYYLKAKEYFFKTGNIKQAYIIDNNMGVMYQNMGNFNKATKYFKSSSEAATKKNDKEQMMMTLHNIGHLKHKQGNYKKSIEYTLQAKKLAEELNNLSSLSNAYQLLGNNYDYLGQDDLALEYHNKNLDIAHRVNDERSIAIAYNNMGNIYISKGEYKKALEYFTKSLKLKEKQNNIRRIAVAYNNIGETYYQMGQLDSALFYYNKALVINNENNFTSQLSDIYLNLGKLNTRFGNYKKAEDYLLKTKKIDAENNIRDNQNLYLFLSELYEKKGDLAKSLTYYKYYSENRDSILNTEKIKIIENLRFEYELDEKNREIELLHKERQIDDSKLQKQSIVILFAIISIFLFLMIVGILIWLYIAKRKTTHELEIINAKMESKNDEISETSIKLRQANEELEKSITTKDRLFSIIAHDLRNPFQSLIGLSNLLRDNYESIDEEKRRRFICEISKTSENSLNLLENLLTWARAQTGRLKINPTQQNIYEITVETIALVKDRAQNKQLLLENHIDTNLELNIDYNSFTTILRNLLSNAIKYTNPGDKITINAVEKENQLVLEVTDTGIGMSEDKIEELFSVSENISEPGTMNEKGTGLGLILCHELAHKNNGEITVKSKIGEGTCFTVILEISRTN